MLALMRTNPKYWLGCFLWVSCVSDVVQRYQERGEQPFPPEDADSLNDYHPTRQHTVSNGKYTHTPTNTPPLNTFQHSDSLIVTL